MDFDNSLNIAQVIPTVQGEGPLTGTPTLLIRVLGCNLNCSYCDSKYTWEETSNYPGNQIISNENDYAAFLQNIFHIMSPYKLSNLMITGGEPLLYQDNPWFLQMLHDLKPHFLTCEIETNGSLLSSVEVWKYGNICFNISPKLKSNYYKDISQYENLIPNLQHFIKESDLFGVEYVFKFVDTPEHRTQLESIIRNLNLEPALVRLMPWTPPRTKFKTSLDFLSAYGTSSDQTLAYCMSKGYCFTPRLHLYLFEDENEVI